MNSIESIREFMGWCSIINTGVLLLTSVLIIALRDFVSNIHSRLFGLSVADVSKSYFQYLAQYKIAILVFNIVPYFVLVVMT